VTWDSIKNRILGKLRRFTIANYKIEKEVYTHQQMSEDYYKNCQLVMNREKLLELLPKDLIMAEIGVDEGKYAEQILKLCKPKQLYLIDEWDTERYSTAKKIIVEAKFQSEIRQDQIVVIHSKSVQAASRFDNNFFDFIYVDTDHSFLTTSAELEAYRDKMKTNGIIAGHDFTPGNVNSAIIYGVREAVYDFCIKYNWEIIYLTMELDINPSFALRKI
jgi:predicted O-methyltransferase YrrM